jgi:hypothetical protein
MLLTLITLVLHGCTSQVTELPFGVCVLLTELAPTVPYRVVRVGACARSTSTATRVDGSLLSCIDRRGRWIRAQITSIVRSDLI